MLDIGYSAVSASISRTVADLVIAAEGCDYFPQPLHRL